jgi:Putative SAM-dependent methyltransferase
MKDQALLDLISKTFSQTLCSPLLPEYLQSLKTHLYNRSFAEAFPTSKEDTSNATTQEMLETYVIRWMPTRLLCYSRILERIAEFLPTEIRAICIGAGCGSETLALQASLARQCNLLRKLADAVVVDVVDSCPGWEPILSKLTKVASTSLTTAVVSFHHGDIITDFAEFKELCTAVDLVTLMFTLNELVTMKGKVLTTKFLIDLIRSIPRGSLILVCFLEGH